MLAKKLLFLHMVTFDILSRHFLVKGITFINESQKFKERWLSSPATCNSTCMVFSFLLFPIFSSLLVTGIFSIFKCSQTMKENILEATVIKIWDKNFVFETHSAIKV